MVAPASIYGIVRKGGGVGIEGGLKRQNEISSVGDATSKSSNMEIKTLTSMLATTVPGVVRGFRTYTARFPFPSVRELAIGCGP
jgi:hypothetical protein